MPTLSRFDLNEKPRARFLASDNPIIEPLGGMIPVEVLMDRFPDALYNKGRDSHLYKLLLALAGESGAGGLKKRTVASRLKNEGPLLVFKDLDTLYAQTFYFKRLDREIYSYDPENSIIEKQVWDKIYSADQSYKKRIKDYFNGIRMGSSPYGIQLVARAGSGEDVDVFENYYHIFDQFSDDPLGFDRLGFSHSTEEFIIIPRVVPNQSEITNKVRLKFSGIISGGTYQVGYLDESVVLTYVVADDASTRAIHIQNALNSLSLLTNVVTVTPISLSEYEIEITDSSLTAFDIKASPVTDGSLLGTDAELSVEYNVSETYYVARFGGPNQEYYNEIKGGVPVPISTNFSTNNTIMMSPSIERNMLDAVDRIRPSHTVMTVRPAIKRNLPVNIRKVVATSENITMTRFVSGRKDVPWPNADTTKGYFIQGTVVITNEFGDPVSVEVENEAPSLAFGTRSLPTIFQDISAIFTYTEGALLDSIYNTKEFYTTRYPLHSSIHVGKFDRTMQLIYPFLITLVDNNDIFDSLYVKANQETPLVFSTSVK